MKILILGGTAEARQLANRLVASGQDVTTSLAGRTQDPILPEGALRGHAFHYARAEIDAKPLALASNPNRGPSREGIYRDRRMTASFMHFYFPSNPEAALRLFLDADPAVGAASVAGSALR